MSKDKKDQKKKETKEETAPIPKDSGKIRLILPKDLESKIRSESNPDAVAAEALAAFYSENSRSNSIIQKEIDNNIIEIQRRHISDLKDQLKAVNHNYEELMKTYQAYMLQVQPLIEKAQLTEGQEVKKISEAEEKEEAAPLKDETKDVPLRDETGGVQEKVEAVQDKVEVVQEKVEAVQDEMKIAQDEKTGSAFVEKKKKWYEFWK